MPNAQVAPGKIVFVFRKTKCPHNLTPRDIPPGLDPGDVACNCKDDPNCKDEEKLIVIPGQSWYVIDKS